ncbi:MAG: sigma-70 family RNA polymerase sigma factor [Planctomycetota bacterium]
MLSDPPGDGRSGREDDDDPARRPFAELPGAAAPAGTLAGLLEDARWLRQLARRFVADENRVDDLVQQTRIRVWEAPPWTDRPVRPWLRKVVLNLVRTDRRNERRRQRRERLAAASEVAPVRPDGVELRELQERVAKALLALDEPYRGTLIERFYLDRSPDEIARREGVLANTVRVRTKRALSQLSARLRQGQEGDRRGDRCDWLSLLGVLGVTEAAKATSRGASAQTVDSVFPSDLVEPPALRPVRLGSTRSSMRRTPRAAVGAVVLVCAVAATLGWSLRGRSESSTPRSHVVATGAPAFELVDLASRGSASGDRERALAPASSESAAFAHGVGVVIVRDASTGAPIAGAELYLGAFTMRSEDLARGKTAIEQLVRPFCTERIGLSDESGAIATPAHRLREERMLIRARGFQELQERARFRDVREPYCVELARAPRAQVRAVGPRGESIAGARVRVEGSQGDTSAGVTDEQGRFDFDWQDSDYAVVIEAPGFAASRSLAAYPDTEVALVPGDAARGVVMGPFGAVANCEVEIAGGAWQGEGFRTRTDERGGFEVVALPTAGQVEVRVMASDLAPLRITRALPWVGEPVFELAAGCFVEGFVNDSSGRRAAAGQALLVPLRTPFLGRDLVRGAIDEDGGYRVGPVPPGDYTLCVEHPTDASTFVEIEPLLAGTSTMVPVRLSAGARVTGRVATANGDPVVGARVQVGWICGDELRGPIAVTGADGRFDLTGLPSTPPLARPASRDLRWTAVLGPDADRPRPALVLELLRPFDLLHKNGASIPRYRTFGSRNTCEVVPGETNIELGVAPVESPPMPRFVLTDPLGQPIRTVTNLLIVSPEDPLHDSQVVFGGTTGNPVKLHDGNALVGCMLVFISRTHALGFARLASLPAAESVAVALAPLRDPALELQVTGADGMPVASLPILAIPRIDDRDADAAILLGTSDDSGRLEVRCLPPGDISFCHPRRPEELDGARPLATALPVSAAHRLGSFRIAEVSPRIVELRLSARSDEAGH